MRIHFDDGLDTARLRKSVEHFDEVTELRPPVETPEGFLRAEGRVARLGVLSYELDNGSEFRELVIPEELFCDSTMETHRQLPLTLEHPTKDGVRIGLTSLNTKEFAVGSVANPRIDGDWLITDILITDEVAKQKVRSGWDKLSAGYYADVWIAPGVLITDDGSEIPFDAIQKNRRGNHVALCRVARAGDRAHLRADSLDWEKKMATKKIKVFGTEVEVDEKKADEILAGQQRHDSETQVALNVEKAKREVLEAEKKKTDEEASKKTLHTDAQKEVIARTALILKARPIIGKKDEKDETGKTDQELLHMDSVDIMKACIAKRLPSVKVDGRSKEELIGMFDVLPDLHTDSASQMTEQEVGALHTDAKDDDLEKAYARSVTNMTNAWKPKQEQKANA